MTSLEQNKLWTENIDDFTPQAGADREIYIGPVRVRVKDYSEFAVSISDRGASVPYMKVSGLLRMFADAHGRAAEALKRPVRYSVRTEIIPTGNEILDKRFITVKVTVSSDLVGEAEGIATGVVLTPRDIAEAEHPGQLRREYGADVHHCIENAATSALGRALRALGVEVLAGTTYEEIMEARRREAQAETSPGKTPGAAKAEKTLVANEFIARVNQIAMTVGNAEFAAATTKYLQNPRHFEEWSKLSEDDLLAKIAEAWTKWQHKKGAKPSEEEQSGAGGD